MIGNITVEAQPAKPSIRQIKVDLLAEPSLGADTEAVTGDQHADHQLRIDRRATHRAVERRKVAAQLRQINKAVDRPQ